MNSHIISTYTMSNKETAMTTANQPATTNAPNSGSRKPADKPYKDLTMEGPIASWYAKNTKGDMRGYRACAEQVTKGLFPGARILEVAPGPGYLAFEIARRGDFRVHGLDISDSFVKIAS